MRKRPTQRSARPAQLPLMEPLELRRMLSVTMLGDFAGTMLISSSNVPQSAARLTSAPDGSLWYTANGNLQHRLTNGQTATIAIPGLLSDTPATITSNLAISTDSGVWFAVAEGSNNLVLHLTSAGALIDASAPSALPINYVAASGNQVWFNEGNALVEKSADDPNLITIDLPVLNGVTGLTVDAQGNAWFAGNNASGQGVVGRVTTAGIVSTYAVSGHPTEIVASHGNMIFGDQNAVWRLAADGSMTQVSFPGVNPRNVNIASDGAVWFIDAAGTGNAVVRLGPSGNKTRYSLDSPSTLNSLAITPDARIWVLGSGVLTMLQSSFSVVDNATYAVANSYVASVGSTGIVLTFNGSLGAVLTGSGNVSTEPRSSGNIGNTTTISTDPPSARVVRTLKSDFSPAGAAPVLASAQYQTEAHTDDPGVFEGEFAVAAPASMPETEQAASSYGTQPNRASSTPSTMAQAASHSAWLMRPIHGGQLESVADIQVAFYTASGRDLKVAQSAFTAAGTMNSTPSNLAVLMSVADFTLPQSRSSAHATDPDQAAVTNAEDSRKLWDLLVYMTTAVGADLNLSDIRRYFKK